MVKVSIKPLGGGSSIPAERGGGNGGKDLTAIRKQNYKGREKL